MKILFWFFVSIIVLGMIFLFGNTLRCVSQDVQTACPELCAPKAVKCEKQIDPNCSDGYKCSAPEFKQYLLFMEKKLGELKKDLKL